MEEQRCSIQSLTLPCFRKSTAARKHDIAIVSNDSNDMTVCVAEKALAAREHDAATASNDSIDMTINVLQHKIYKPASCRGYSPFPFTNAFAAHVRAVSDLHS